MRAVQFDRFGGPEVLEVREVGEPHAGPGRLRVRVLAAGVNPMDWMVAADEQTASMLGVTVPSGFGFDYAGSWTRSAMACRASRSATGCTGALSSGLSPTTRSSPLTRVRSTAPRTVSTTSPPPAERLSTIAARDPELAVQATGGRDAAPGTLERIADLIAEGKLTVPIAARYPIEKIRDAVTLQAARHVRGKVVVTL